MLPETRSGTSRISVSPATGDEMPFSSAALREIALSNARGPSTRAPVICPRRAMSVRQAASSVDAMAGLTVSTADSTATFGTSIPRRWKKSIAFCIICALALRSGTMLIAASVTPRRLWVGRKFDDKDVANAPTRHAEPEVFVEQSVHQGVRVNVTL